MVFLLFLFNVLGVFFGFYQLFRADFTSSFTSW